VQISEHKLASASTRLHASIRFMFILRAIGLVVSLGSSVVLARMLLPHEFGIAAMAGYTLMFFAALREFGITAATIQQTKISEDESSAIFWFNSFMTLAFTCLTIAAAPLISDFYAEPIIKEVLLGLCIGFALTGISAQHSALLKRQLYFGYVLIAEGCGLICGFIAAVLVALQRHDVWALVAMNLTQALVSAILSMVLCGWIPGSPVHMLKHKSAIRFGVGAVLYSGLNFLTNNAAGILIGRVFGSDSLGQYSRAWQLYSMPGSTIVTPMLTVMFPYWCRIREHGDSLKQSYLQFIRRLSLFWIPAAFALPFISTDLIRLLLGPNWELAGVILGCLAPTMAALGMVAPFSQLMLCLGRTRELRIWAIVELFIRGGGAAVGCLVSPVGAAVGFSTATLLVAVPIIVFTINVLTDISWKDQLMVVLPSWYVALSTIAAGSVGYFLVAPAAGRSALLSLTIKAAALFVGWLAATWTIPQTRKILIATVGRDSAAAF
jgi:O-antigen/teichoic acid export membrane protein